MSTIELPNGRRIGPDEPCYIVAEVGQNHNGDAYTATRLFKMAADAGCDAVKLCKRHIPSELTREAYDAPYVGPQSFGATYGKHREALELSPREYAHLKARIAYNDWPLTLFATACDRQSVDDVEAAIGPPLYKVASRDLDNLPLIDYVARLGKPVILSTGMARPDDIERALKTILARHNQIVLLCCVSVYPCPDDLIRLDAIGKYADAFGVLVGFSDHTVGIHMAPAAVALGAVMVEKHITLARVSKGTDHAGSLEAAGLVKMVRNIRAIEVAYQPKVPLPLYSVAPSCGKLARSLVSANPIDEGELIKENDVVLKSPGDGVHWPNRCSVIGHRAARDIPADVTIRPADIEE